MSILKCASGPVGDNKKRSYNGPAGFPYGYAVKQGAADDAVIAVTGAGQKCLGINLFSDVANSGTLTIVRGGETKAIAGAALAADVECMVDSTGRVIASTAQGDNVLGRTITSSTGADQEVVFDVAPYIR